MAEKVEIDLEVTAEAKRRIASMFKESLVSAEMERLTMAAKTPAARGLDRANEVAGKLAGVASQAAGGIRSAMQGNVSGAMSGLFSTASAAEGMGGGIGMAAKALGKAGPIAMAVTEAVGAVVSVVKQGWQQIVGFIGSFNPVGVERLNQAFEDINGVIGSMLNPALDVMIPLIRDFGDTVASMIPDLTEFFAAFEPIVDLMRELGTLAGDALKPFIQAFVDMLTLIIKVISAAIKPLADALGVVNKASGAKARRKSSVGMSGRMSKTTGIEELGKNLQLAAFSTPMGMNAQDTPEKKTATNTQKIADTMSIVAAGVDILVNGMQGVVRVATRFPGQGSR